MSIDHEMRRTGLGSTDTAAILGLDPWRDAYSVWVSKKEPAVWSPEPSDEMLLGTCLQQGIFDYYKRKTGYNAEWRDVTIRHPRNPILIGSPDGVVPDLKKVVEIKTISHNWNEWGPTSDDVPDQYKVQAWHQMALLDYDSCDLVPLVRGEVRIYTILRDEEVIRQMQERQKTFWSRYVEGDEEPPIGTSEWTKNWIKQRFPHHSSDLREASEQEVALLEEYAGVRDRIEPLEDRKAHLETLLRKACAEDAGIQWPGGKFTWKRTKDKTAMDWEGLATELLAHYPGDEEAARLTAKYTYPVPGHRRIHFVCENVGNAAA